MLNNSKSSLQMQAVIVVVLMFIYHNALSDQGITGDDNTQVSGNHNKIVNNENSNNSDNKNTNSVIINIRTNANEVISRLPESKRKVASEVSEIAVDLVEASSTPDNSDIKDKIARKLAELSLLSYQVSSNPFVPPINKTQLMCDNGFSFSYRGHYNKGDEGIYFYVNNKSSSWQRPGDTYNLNEGGQTLKILYLEFDKNNKSPILHYECKKTEKS